MKIMKKILCTVLVVVMCLTSAPIGGLDLTAEAADYKVGDIIQFGSYPQSKVTDNATITALNNKAPAWVNWTSYGYYSGTGDYGTMKQGDWMRYTDIVYNGNKYRGVKFTQYRPVHTYRSSSSGTFQDDNGYYTNTVYWFKFEPIDWRVLDPATGLVMCETIIDSQPYSNTVYHIGDVHNLMDGYFNDASYTNYACDYETSSIRQWLNDDFYNTAFADNEKKEINTTALNNDGYYTLIGRTGHEDLDSNPTNDKIFLLSYKEVRNSNFGFGLDYNYEPTRQAQSSDYAKSQGLWVSTNSDCYGNSHWLLRSPGDYSSGSCEVTAMGGNANHNVTQYSTAGIRPALRIDLDEIGEEPTENIYNLGEETYSFENFGDSDSFGGHCFGMSTTSSGYYLGELNVGKIGVSSCKAVFTLNRTTTVKAPICYYQPIQGSYAIRATVAGGTNYKSIYNYGKEKYDIEADWNDIISYVKNHQYDNSGRFQIGFQKKNQGGHAINFLYYSVVNGQERIYVYDNNFPNVETYFYKDSSGKVYQAPYSTFLGNIDCMALRDVSKYFSVAGNYDATDCMYADANQVVIEDAVIYPMDCSEGNQYMMYEFSDSKRQVRVEPLCDNATFTYMGVEYSFGDINDDTYGIFTLSTTDDTGSVDKSNLQIFNGYDNCSCNCHAGGIKGFFFKFILFFQKIFRTNKVCKCGINHY